MGWVTGHGPAATQGTASMRTKTEYLLTAGRLGRNSVRLVTLAVVLIGVGAVMSLAQASPLRPPVSSYKFEDLAITRHVAADGKPLSGFVSYFRLNRALPFAPRRKFEGEEEGGPRLFAAYVSVDRVHDEGSTETMGDDASRHCYTEAIEVHAHQESPPDATIKLAGGLSRVYERAKPARSTSIIPATNGTNPISRAGFKRRSTHCQLADDIPLLLQPSAQPPQLAKLLAHRARRITTSGQPTTVPRNP